MNVLYVYPGKLRGHGLDLVARQHLQAFAEAGWSVDCLSRGAVGHPGLTCHRLRYTPANLLSFLPASYYYGAQSRFFGFWARQSFEAGRHHLVVAFEGSGAGVFPRARRAGAVTALVCPMGHFREAGRILDKSWPSMDAPLLEREYQEADRILVRSPQAAQTFVRHGEDPARMVVVPGGVDETVFYPADHSLDRPFRLLFCGRLSERKGIRQVVEAWKAAALSPQSAELWLVGAEPKEMSAWLDQKSDPGIRRLGFVKDVAAIMRQCDAQILLSEAEGMPKSLVEGACSGLATLTTLEGGFPVRDGVTGWTVVRDDLEGVAQRIRKLALDRDLTWRMGLEARREVLQQYTWAAFRRAFIEGLRPLLPDSA